ncbi:unnamed protein product [Victoria cruziana]
MWISGFIIVGAAAHASIFMIRDYDSTTRYNDQLDRILRHRDAMISLINWVCIFLRFHSFRLYIHNDTMSTLGHPQDMFLDTAIQLQPIFGQWIQNTHALAPSATAPVGGKVTLLPIPLGTTDFLVHHIHAFTIHVIVLIQMKGILFVGSSRLIPDKANLVATATQPRALYKDNMGIFLGFHSLVTDPEEGENAKYPPRIMSS